ncbi:type I-C CRISPR-associated protein Cas8c/Csd1 [Schleiferilactobacillus perolens]|jgi:hypothetical protein|uniref:type I-C CRISPR-associated protein Cas8c/Csd1 n=1 Tax=Schleiferilactobacillus perolens TaxID=100468 RepID=UPI002356EF97|nr:type I-C CRISPR-associated protein Cas8c/Csd1 [Schleiferilactobacillus perolens]MCI2170024.1 type I-C CRISPR-associated protein Cas8c/Csd1 [Schleiferilactobacillus perolens]
MQFYTDLFELFEQNKDIIGHEQTRFTASSVSKPIPYMLLPPGVYQVNGGLRIFLTDTGELTSMADDDRVIGTMATPKAGSRSTKILAHAVFDRPEYLAKQSAVAKQALFPIYAGKNQAKAMSEQVKKHQQYMDNLGKWIQWLIPQKQFQRVCTGLQAIEAYLQHHDLIADMQARGIDLSPAIAGKWVYFDITGLHAEANYHFWRDLELYTAWWAYYQQTSKSYSGIDLITGENTQRQLATFSRGIVRSFSKAKLVSFNRVAPLIGWLQQSDFENGLATHFMAPMDETKALKAENMLAYLQNTQSLRIGDKDFFTFWSNSPTYELPLNDVATLIGFTSYTGDDEKSPKTGATLTNAVKKVLTGQDGQAIEQGDTTISILHLAIPGEGRISVVGYNKMPAKKFVQQTRQWYAHCRWQFSQEKFRVPSLTTLARLLNSDHISKKSQQSSSSQAMESQWYQMLMAVLLHSGPLPAQVVSKAQSMYIHTAMLSDKSNANAVKVDESWRWDLLALLAYDQYHQSTHLRRDGKVMENRERSQQFGKLWAVLDYVERSVLTKRFGPDGVKQTNAESLMPTFQARPSKALEQLINRVNPYWISAPRQYREDFNRILTAMKEQQFTDQPLEAVWLYAAAKESQYLSRRDYAQNHEPKATKNGEI